jgi:hypothetical protein
MARNAWVALLVIGCTGVARGETGTALAELLDSVGLHKTFAEARSLLPNVAWSEAPDKMMNRYFLSTEEAFDLAAMRFSARLSDGEAGAQQIEGVWRGHGYTLERCRVQLNALVVELEKRYGPVRATPASKFDTSNFLPVKSSQESMGAHSAITLREEDYSALKHDRTARYFEWHAEGLTDGGISVVVGGQYFDTDTLLGQKRDCGASFEISDTTSTPRRVIANPTVIVSTPPKG